MRTSREHLRITFDLDVIKGEGVEIGDRVFREIKPVNAIPDDFVAVEVVKILASSDKGEGGPLGREGCFIAAIR